MAVDRALYEAVKQVFAGLGHYSYEHSFIDNASKDATLAIFMDIAREDRNVAEAGCRAHSPAWTQIGDAHAICPSFWMARA